MNKNLDELPLENVPVLTEKEIRLYNWKEHTFSLKKGFSLEEKLEGKVPLSGKPFVVVADSERVYLGSFWTPISSFLKFQQSIPYGLRIIKMISIPSNMEMNNKIQEVT